MKRTILSVAAALMMATCVIAQDIPAGMRMELIESEDDSRDQYTIFKYKEKNGNEAYYMGVGNYMFPIPKKDISPFIIKDIDKYRSFVSEEEKSKYISLLKTEMKAITWAWVTRLNSWGWCVTI